jgi:hypothetical protein
MKTLLLILLLAFTASAQSPDWKFIPEMSRDIVEGYSVKTYLAEIRRGNGIIKFRVKYEFPHGVPEEAAKKAGKTFNSPGHTTLDIRRVEADGLFDCNKLSFSVKRGVSDIYLEDGTRVKSTERIRTSNTEPALLKFVNYLCELPTMQSGGPPVLKPTLKP